jgi:hypothetical protein
VDGPRTHLEMLARRDVARVARDADHFVAAVEQFLGDGATGVGR